MQSKKKKEQTGITALYCRLSRDDGAEGEDHAKPDTTFVQMQLSRWLCGSYKEWFSF